MTTKLSNVVAEEEECASAMMGRCNGKARLHSEGQVCRSYFAAVRRISCWYLSQDRVAHGGVVWQFMELNSAHSNGRMAWYRSIEQPYAAASGYSLLHIMLRAVSFEQI
jgi:hypothetical protein